jgi:hypothetical protein
MRTGTGTGWISGRERFEGNEIEVDVEAAEELARTYFKMNPTRRRDLHILIDRLDRASHGDDIADRLIDLGIALEALLLHELDGQARIAVLLIDGGPFDQFRHGLAAGLRRLRESLRYLFRALISMRNRRFVLIFAARLATGALTAAARRSMSSAMAA